jgi:hypothetical protein
MTAQFESSSKSWAEPPDSQGLPDVLQGCAALLVVMIGVLSLIHDSWGRHVLESWINIHVLFAVTLFGLLLARCQSCVKRGAPLLPPDVRALCRDLSRFVYVMIYAVIGIRQCVGIVGGMWHDAALSSPADSARFDPKGDFPLLFITTLVALALVRFMAFRLLPSAIDWGRHSAVD